MRILHTSDLHFGQVIYRHYERLDEHRYFFEQLRDFIDIYDPDLLLISGDIFDVAQPSASVWTDFNSEIVDLHRRFPELNIVIVAGNHDSASRIESHSKVWKLAGITVVGTPPPILNSASEGWEERYIVKLPSGFVIAIPYMSGDRSDAMVHLQEYVANLNTRNLPVVMTGHIAVVGSDLEGHDVEIGNMRTVSLDRFGSDYDYLALGHIHKPQTIGHKNVFDEKQHVYPAPVARYSGSVVHVSEDEKYPHSVSLVDIDRHGGDITIQQLKIKQFRHFVTLPIDDSFPFESAKDALSYLKRYVGSADKVYFRFRFSQNASIPADFNSLVYDIIDKSGKDIRFNPRMIFVASDDESITSADRIKHQFELEDIKQMTDPREFIRKTSGDYPGLTEKEIDDLFYEVECFLKKNDGE